MAIRTYKVTLDSKNTIAPEPVFLRQGDKTGAVVIDATLMDNGSPVSLSGLVPMFKANTADGQAVIADSTGFNIVNASGGEFTYQVPNTLSSVPGKIKVAYFSFSDSSGSQSTFNVVFVVEKAADMTQESAKDWVSNLNEIISQYNQWVNDAHSSWQDFVNENKEIIESIDPGGTLLTEIIAARNGKSDLKTRLDDEHAQVTEQFAETDVKINRTKYFVNAKDFGALGNGTDETVLLQQALNAVPSGGEFHIPSDSVFKFSTLTVTQAEIKITGKGVLDGTIVIDAPVVVAEMMFNINGVTFSPSTLKNAIEIKRARRGIISDCIFKNVDKAIFCNPNSGAADHSIGQIIVDKNQFYNVNYAFYVSLNGNSSWMITNDCHFTNNIVNIAKIQHIYCEAIDGILIEGNTFFFPSSNMKDQTKKQNIYIGYSDWVHISGNNLFESGEESIVLDSPKHFTISDNLFAYCGQKELYDVIKIIGNRLMSAMIITDNTISKFTKNAIGVYSTGSGSLVIKNNLIENVPANDIYYGETPLTSISHYGIYQDTTSTVDIIESGNEIVGGSLTHNLKGSLSSSVRLNYRSQIAAIYTSKSVTTSNTIIFDVCSLNDNTSNFDGIVIIEAKNNTSEEGNLASYILHIAKHALGQDVSIISQKGLIEGVNANHPSFTFSMNDKGQLLASPISATSGTFHFFVSYMGNIKLK